MKQKKIKKLFFKNKTKKKKKLIAVVCVMQFCDPHIFLVAIEAKFMYKLN